MTTPNEIIKYIFNPQVIEEYFDICVQANNSYSPSSFPFHNREYTSIRWQMTFVSMAVALRYFPQYQKELTRGFYDHIMTQTQKVRVGDFLNLKQELSAIKSDLGGFKLFSPVDKVIELKIISLILFKNKLEGLIRLINSFNNGQGPQRKEEFYKLGFMFSGAILYSYWGRELNLISDDSAHNELGILIMQHLAPILKVVSQ